MDAMRFDKFVSTWASGVSRRRVVIGAVAGAAGALGVASEGVAKKRRKKRCKPRPAQAVCQSNKQCCTKKTGRVCAANAKDDNCNLTSTVCCLPLNARGCRDTCDCCGPDALCVAELPSGATTCRIV